MSECKKLLDNLYIAAPCPVKWEDMDGDDMVRACSGCSKNVYNISAMTRQEAENFLQINGVSQCMRFYRRSDGTIMTDDCPVALRKIRDKMMLVAGFAASLLSVALSIPAAIGQSVKQRDSSCLRQMIDVSKLKKPPKGFKYYPNPAGGGLILRPETYPGTPVPNAPANPKTGWQKPVKPGKKTPNRQKPQPARTNPRQPARADGRTLELYRKAKRMELKENTKMAEFYLSKAIDAYDKQPSGDRSFRKLLVKELNQLKNRSVSEPREIKVGQ